MKKEKIVYFKYANPNPSQKYKKNGNPYKWQKPDCVIRAFAIATDKSWEEAFDILCGIAKEEFDVPNSRPVLEKALEKYGQESELPTQERRETTDSQRNRINISGQDIRSWCLRS